MKILIATAVYYPQVNGVAVFAHNLALGLVRRGHEVVVVAPSLDGKKHIKNEEGVRTVYLKSMELKVYPDQVHPVPKGRKLFYKHGLRASVFPKKELRKVFEEFGPDLVHVQVSDPIGIQTVKLARELKIPVVTTEHNQPEVIVESLKMPKLMKRGVEKGLKKFFVARQKKSDFVTMPTKEAILDLLEGEDFRVPVAAVSNGVDLTNFKPGKVSEELYKQYGVSKEAVKVIYVGRIDPEKKVGSLIEAGIGARKKLPLLEIVVVGDGVERPKLVEKYKKYVFIKFLGKVLPPELYEIYHLGDVFATASEIETQGIVLIEAAATGLPLVAVDKGAVREVCQNEKNGFLVKAGDIEALSEALVKILGDKNLREKFSKESLKIAAEHDFEKTLDRFINIYNKVLDDKVK